VEKEDPPSGEKYLKVLIGTVPKHRPL